MQPDQNRLVLTPARLTRLLAAMLGFVFGMHALAMVVAHGFGYPVALGFVPLFHIDFEDNVPTFAAFMLLIACALVCAWSSALETSRPRHMRAWALIAVLFLGLAADEAFGFHEQLDAALHVWFSEVDLPLFAWILPYGFTVGLIGLFLLRWFLELERPLQVRLFAAGALFLSGAIGLELVSGGYYQSLPADRETFRTLTVDLLSTAEEACEFAGDRKSVV